jgi:hypothetical protein
LAFEAHGIDRGEFDALATPAPTDLYTQLMITSGGHLGCQDRRVEKD